MCSFSSCCGRDEYVCQAPNHVGNRVLCSGCKPPEWRMDITKSEHAGNVCPDCLRKHNQKFEIKRPSPFSNPIVLRRMDTAGPMSLYEYCSIESGYPIGSQKLREYVNRHYGHD